MEGTFLNTWKNKMVILASASPRRNMLIKGLDIPYTVVVPEEKEEVYPSTLPVEEIPVFLARRKATFNQHLVRENTILLTADTIVVQYGNVIQKPVDRTDAEKILQQLSGNMHTVLTGVCLRSKKQEKCFTTKTKVWFGSLTEDEISYYLDRYKPYDKAGAYGIQEWIGYAAIEKIEGSFYNVMGLPIYQVYNFLKTF